jgi:hypothetical protein
MLTKMLCSDMMSSAYVRTEKASMQPRVASKRCYKRTSLAMARSLGVSDATCAAPGGCVGGASGAQLSLVYNNYYYYSQRHADYTWHCH